MKKVLMVDDDYVNLMMAQQALSDEYKVYIVNSGKLAVQFIRMYKPDLVLLDAQMPYLDGVETLAKIRQFDKFLKIPVVLMTKKKNQELLSKTSKLGVFYYLERPFGANVLREVVDKAFEII